jgi:transcriptional regulator with XRE-family HTH domain
MISERDFQIVVGNRLQRFRVALGRSQKDVADILGVGATAVSNYEKGGRMLGPYEAMKLKTRLGIPLEWLYGGDESVLTPQQIAKLVQATKRQRSRRHLSKEAKRPAA